MDLESAKKFVREMGGARRWNAYSNLRKRVASEAKANPMIKEKFPIHTAKGDEMMDILAEYYASQTAFADVTELRRLKETQKDKEGKNYQWMFEGECRDKLKSSWEAVMTNNIFRVAYWPGTRCAESRGCCVDPRGAENGCKHAATNIGNAKRLRVVEYYSSWHHRMTEMVEETLRQHIGDTVGPRVIDPPLELWGGMDRALQKM